jgi:hypothetical protein
MEVSRLSTVTATAEDIGLDPDSIRQGITPELGEDFAAFTEWLNYIHFPAGTEDGKGLGVVLEIEDLKMPDNLALYIRSEAFGLDDEDEFFQPLVNDKDPASGAKLKGATLKFLNKDNGGYELKGDTLTGGVSIGIELGMQNEEDQGRYETEKILTITNVEPGVTLGMTGGTAKLAFDWIKMSIQPKEHTSGDDDPLPDYPFIGTFPDKDKGEQGIDLSAMPQGLSFYTPDEAEDGGFNAQLYITLNRKSYNEETGEWEVEGPGYGGDDPGGWGKNLQINLPSLNFYFEYADGSESDNLFTYEQDIQKDTGDWTLSHTLTKIMEDLVESEYIMDDTENEDNPFKLYTAPSLPEQNKAIPLGNFAKALGDVLSGEKKGPLFLRYEVGLTGGPGEENGEENEAKPGEILLYPEMLTKKIAASVDLLMVIPLILKANSQDAPVTITIAPDLGDADLFQRKNPDDNEYFDMISSFGFDIAIKNMAGLNAGKVFLENKIDVKKLRYRLPLVDFANPLNNHLSLDGGEMEKIKALWPFIPQVSIEFEPDTVLRIERNFNIELQSITVKAGGEYTFETGL